MSTRFVNRFFAWALAVSFVGQITAGGVVKPAAAPVKWEPSAAYVTKWNGVAKNWHKAHGEKHVNKYIKTLEAKFNPQFEREDKSYFVTTAIQSEDFPQIAKTDKGVVFTLKADPTKKLEISHVEATKFLVNGKEFNYNVKADLKTNMEAMGNLLGVDVAQKQSFLEQLFLPRAEAALPVWAIILITAAVVYVGINLYNNWNKAEVGAKQVQRGVENLHEAGGLPTVGDDD